MEFRVNIWNDYTCQGDAKIFFTDLTYSKLDSINLNIARGHIAQNGDIVNPGFSHDTIQFSNQIQKLSTANYIIFNIKVDMKHASNTHDFQYYHLYKLSCHIGARVDFTLNNL